MSWGAHGVMGELKSPLGMMALAALFLLTSGHLVLGVLAILPFAKKLLAALFPVTLGHSVLGVPCFLLLFDFFFGCPSVVGSFCEGASSSLVASLPRLWLAVFGCCCTLGSCDQAFVVSDAVSRVSAWYSADESEVVARMRGCLAAFFCGCFVRLVWGEGICARFALAYVVAAEGQRAFHKRIKIAQETE